MRKGLQTLITSCVLTLALLFLGAAGMIPATGPRTASAAPGWSASSTALPTTPLATLTVSTVADIVDGDTSSLTNLLAAPGPDGAISLREAIIAANRTAGADTIMLPAGTYTLALPGADEDAAATGDLDLTGDVTITGAGSASTIIEAGTTSANGIDRLFHVFLDVTAGFTDLTIRHGRNISTNPVGGSGGGISNSGTVTITGSTLSNNYALAGGGIVNFQPGSVTIINSRLANNSADFLGGGVSNNATMTITDSTLSNNSSGIEGGAIYTIFGHTTITGSTLANNSSGFGGAISTDAFTTESFGIIEITNSTLSNNSAELGGGIWNDGKVRISNSTLAGNAATFRGGGVVNSHFMEIKNSIIANSPLGDNALIAIPLTNLGGNLSTDATCPGFTQVTAAQLNLGPLQDNGGPTQTHALLAGSVAIDAVTDCTNVDSNPLTQDQRGLPRPIDGDSDGVSKCDIGAYEAATCTSGDQTPPTVTCPAPITVNNTVKQCSAVVSFSASAMDNCDGPIAPTCSPASGATFAVGTTTVTCTATDRAGRTGQCAFTVTVNDTHPPAITCPANIIRSNDPNQCSAVATYSLPAVSDNCSGVGAPSCTPPSGTTFPKGITTVTCTSTDSSGNQTSCSFTITVQDTQPPTITCPANIVAVTAQTCPLTNLSVVNFPTPMAADNCSSATVLCTPPSGSAFPVGATTVTCRATDSAGRTASCSFTVTVFNGCLQDDANPAVGVLFNTATGEYRFCGNGAVFTGIGTRAVQGCVVTIQRNAPDVRLSIRADLSQKKGTASLQFLPGATLYTITDRDLSNNTCPCGAHLF